MVIEICKKFFFFTKKERKERLQNNIKPYHVRLKNYPVTLLKLIIQLKQLKVSLDHTNICQAKRNPTHLNWLKQTTTCITISVIIQTVRIMQVLQCEMIKRKSVREKALQIKVNIFNIE